MKTPDVYAFEVINRVPHFGEVFHLLRRNFTLCDIISIGDIVITGAAQEDPDKLDEICDFLKQNTSRDPNNQAKRNWNLIVFDKYWRDLSELDSLLVYYFGTTSNNKFRKFNDYEWFFCYHIWDNGYVELYTTRKDVIPFITANYEVKVTDYPGKMGFHGDLMTEYIFE